MNSYFIIVSGDKNIKYRILSVWNDTHNLDFTLIDGFKTYSSYVTEETLRTLANKYNTNFETYIMDIRHGLQSNNSDTLIYKRSGEIFSLSRKRGKISLQFFDLTLKEVDFASTIITVVDEINKANQFHENEARRLRKEIDDISEEKNQLIAKLAEFANKKKDMEHELYSKFILILNEKKLRIQYLQEMLEKFKTDGVLQDIKSEASFKQTKLNKEIISDSDSEGNRDEELIPEKIQKEIKGNVSKQKQNFLDEEDVSTSIISLPKRLKINLESSKSTEKISTEDNNITNDVISSTNEDESPEKMAEDTNKDDSQNSLNFNTQDLFDRL